MEHGACSVNYRPHPIQMKDEKVCEADLGRQSPDRILFARDPALGTFVQNTTTAGVALLTATGHTLIKQLYTQPRLGGKGRECLLAYDKNLAWTRA